MEQAILDYPLKRLLDKVGDDARSKEEMWQPAVTAYAGLACVNYLFPWAAMNPRVLR